MKKLWNLIRHRISGLSVFGFGVNWVSDQSTPPPRSEVAEHVASYEAGQSVLAELVDSQGHVLDLDITSDPNIATYQDSVSTHESPPSYIFLVDPNGGGTEGIQINAFGLNNIENVLGWGGPTKGIMLRGTYRVIDSGIGTGGVQWVALQAQPK